MQPRRVTGGLVGLLVWFALAVAVTACYGGDQVAPGGNPIKGGIRYYHDDEHAVSCWTTSDLSLSCLPDSQLGQP